MFDGETLETISSGFPSTHTSRPLDELGHAALQHIVTNVKEAERRQLHEDQWDGATDVVATQNDCFKRQKIGERQVDGSIEEYTRHVDPCNDPVMVIFLVRGVVCTPSQPAQVLLRRQLSARDTRKCKTVAINGSF